MVMWVMLMYASDADDGVDVVGGGDAGSVFFSWVW